MLQVKDSADLYSGLIVDFLQFLSPQNYLGHLCASLVTDIHCYYSNTFLKPVLSCMSCAVLLSQEREAQNEAEPRSSEPSERELALQEALHILQQEKDSVTAQFQAQVGIKVTHA